MTDLSSLIDRVEAGESSNELDVLIEVALFEPEGPYASARPNSAGTKVIYTGLDGKEITHRALDWTMTPELTLRDLRALKARIQSHEG